MGNSVELLPGTLDMLILKAVSLRPLHGYAVLQRIRQIRARSSIFRKDRCIRHSTGWNTRP